MSDPDVTQLLQAWRAGDGEAFEQMFPLVERELRQLAAGYLRREREGHTLQTTALVNEAYLRLVRQREADWASRAHFLGIAARLMRRILVDHARRRSAGKRGGPGEALALDDVAELVGLEGPDAVDLVAVNRALEELERIDPRQVRIVELRVFGGLKNHEIAEALGISRSTVKREWQLARAWLLRALSL